MIESFKLPNITPETLTGSIVSFNDEYGGLSLKSCTSLITGYQEGSGTPSPSNVRNLVSFNSATLTENGNTHLFTFGQSIYQGYIDWKMGVAVGNMVMADLGNLNWNYRSDISVFYSSGITDINLTADFTGLITSIYETVISSTPFTSMLNNQIKRGGSDQAIVIKDNRYTDANEFKTAMNGVMLAYELATPIEIPLGGINLLTQDGVNNIFCDTGDTTLEWLKVN